MKKLGPGMWEDDLGILHFDFIVLLDYLGWPDTPDNHERLAKLIAEHMKSLGADPIVLKGNPHPSEN